MKHIMRSLVGGILVAGMIMTPVAGAQNAVPSVQGQQKQLFLSLEEAINIALENNLEIRVEQYNPEIKKKAVRSAEAMFDTQLETDTTQTMNEPASTQSPGTYTNLKAGVSKRFKTGTTYQVDVGLSRAGFEDVETTFTRPDPETGYLTTSTTTLDDSFDASVNFTLIQPLMKNRGVEVNTYPIEAAKKQREIALSELRNKVSDVVSNVKNTYWQLVYALGNLEAKRLSLQLAYDLVKINEAQVEVGTLAPIEVLQAKAAVASREVEIISAEQTVRDVEDGLKLLLNIPSSDPMWDAAIVVNDAPIASEQTISLQDSIRQALENDEQLRQLRKQLELLQMSVNYQQDQALPDVNLIGRVGSSGSETELGETLGDVVGLDKYSLTVGVNFSYPLGNRAAQSDLNTAKLQLEQARLSVQNLEQAITSQVRQAVRSVRSAYKGVEATKVARELAEEQLDAEQKKFNEGLSTNFQVLSYQESLSNARSRETQAIIAYNQALVALDELTGMTLQRHNIVVNE